MTGAASRTSNAVVPSFAVMACSPVCSRLGERAILAAGGAPAVVERRVVGHRELRGQLLVQVDAQTGLVARPVIAVLQLRAPREYVLLRLREQSRLLNPEVRHRQVEMHVRRVPDR